MYFNKLLFNHHRLLVSGIISGFIALCLLSANSIAANGTLYYGESIKPDTLDPYTSREMSSLRLSELIFNGLIGINESQEIVPELAESWEVSTDKKTWIFHLRKNVSWHGKDNKPFNAHDVVFTVNLVKHPKTQSSHKTQFDAFNSVLALDDHTVKFSLTQKSLNSLSLFTFKILPKHKLSRYKYLNKLSSFSNQPIGTGPYSFLSSNTNREITLLANPDYFLGSPKIKKIIMQPFSDKNIMNQALTFNSLDMVVDVDPRHIDELQADSRFSLIGYNTLSYSFFAYNHNNALLNNKLIRQALSYAVNRKQMLKAFYNNNGAIISGPFAPGSWAYNLDVIPLDFDSNKAIALLKQAGLIKTPEGFIDSHGKPVRFNLKVPIEKNNESNKKIVLAYKNYLNKIGIEINLVFLEKKSWKKAIFAQHDFDITFATWAFDDASDIDDIFHSRYNTAWQNNFISYNNPKVDQLLGLALASTDHQEKRTINHKLHEILAEDSPYTFLWSLTRFAAYTNKLKNIQIHPYKFFENAHLWEFK